MKGLRMALHTLLDQSEADLDRLCRRHRVRVLTVFASATDGSAAIPNGSMCWTRSVPRRPPGIAIAEGEPLYESEPTAFANAYAAAVMLYLDTARLRREALAQPRP